MRYRRKFFFAAILCLLCTAINAQDYFRNGKGKTTKSQRTGAWKFFYDDGNLSATGVYKNGLKDGRWEMFHENGKLSLAGVYRDGILIGDFEEFDTNGQALQPPPDYTSVQISPTPPGGSMQSFKQWIAENYQLPQKAVKAGVNGTIMASFVVGTDGNIDQIHIIGDIGYETGEELERILRRSPKWKPGILNGRPVRVKYRIPLTIRTS